MELLLRRRDGLSTTEDWEILMQFCAEQNMTEERINDFSSYDTMYLFTINADNNTHKNESNAKNKRKNMFDKS